MVEQHRVRSQLLPQDPDPGVALDGEVEVGEGRHDQRCGKGKNKDEAVTDVEYHNESFNAESKVPTAIMNLLMIIRSYLSKGLLFWLRQSSYSSESIRDVNLVIVAFVLAIHCFPNKLKLQMSRVSAVLSMLQPTKNIILLIQHFLLHI